MDNKKNMLLINPAVRKETQHPIFNSVVFSSPPLGLGYIAAYLRANNKMEVRIIDEVVSPLSELEIEKQLNWLGSRPTIGISCLTATYSRAKELARTIKQIKPDSFVIFGGAHPTALPEESLTDKTVDLVVRNEGEVTLAEVCEAKYFGRDWSNIKGISFIKNGMIQHNPGRGYAELDSFPDFPYDLFEHNLEHYSDFGMILSSRGCPFDCIFCSNRIITGKKYRTFKVDAVVGQVEKLVLRYNQKSIYFVDDNIVVDKKRFFHLTNMIMERGLHKKAFFTAQFRGEDMTEEILVQMKKSNFKMLSCGMETGSNRLMALLNKGETVEEIKQGIELASSSGFLTTTTFIFGIPTETRKERLDSSRLARRLKLDSARFNIAIPYPGTRLFEIAKSENRLHVSQEWKNFNVQYYLFGDDIPYIPASSGRYALIFDTMMANLKFYLRPKIIWTIIFKTDITGGGVLSLQKRRNILRTYLNLVYIWFFIMKRFCYVGIKAAFEKNGN
ncbi:MAG: radical SAM protein [Candidatus Omnitrophica bacterium]|nr:radical SAM protein [Candidatus Omnitrophota bacterium]MDD5652702.1 radical SAM protein [Candidatus Omnitrophota bacterium]